MKKIPVVLSILLSSALCSLEPPGYRAPSSLYLPANQHRRYRPEGAAAATAPSSLYVPASSSVSPSLPEVVDARSHNFPATSYGVPDYRAAPRYHEEFAEPAKYDFEYRVSDEYGNDFGHKESREGAHTQGTYSVLLPDGRRQIVEYEADEWGFKPRISYDAAHQGADRFDQPGIYPGGPY